MINTSAKSIINECAPSLKGFRLSAASSATAAAQLSKPEVVGACIVSAAGSLPLHMMSFMVALAIAEGRLGIGEAGWISSCFVAGIFTATVALPLAGFQRVTTIWALMGVVVLATALWLGEGYGAAYLLGGWVAVGGVCGTLLFLGSSSAAAYSDRHFVFGLRLALVLFAAAAVIGGAHAFGAFATYRGAAAALAVGFALACCLGLVWYRPPSAIDREASASPMVRNLDRRWDGLLVAVLFFAGQPGFMAYAAHLAIANGVPSAELPAVYAAGKAIGAVALLKWGANARAGAPNYKLGLLLGLAIVAMAAAQEIVLFSCGLVLWEITVNAQSARLQATLVNQQPFRAAMWLPAAVAIGAGVGPVIHGGLLGQTAGHWFVVYSVLSGLLPAAWILHRTAAARASDSSS